MIGKGIVSRNNIKLLSIDLKNILNVNEVRIISQKLNVF